MASYGIAMDDSDILSLTSDGTADFQQVIQHFVSVYFKASIYNKV